MYIDIPKKWLRKRIPRDSLTSVGDRCSYPKSRTPGSPGPSRSSLHIPPSRSLRRRTQSLGPLGEGDGERQLLHAAVTLPSPPGLACRGERSVAWHRGTTFLHPPLEPPSDLSSFLLCEITFLIPSSTELFLHIIFLFISLSLLSLFS